MNAWQQNLTRLFLLVGVVIFIGSGYVWWTKIYTNPERIFWSTAANNLATTGVTRSVSTNAQDTAQSGLQVTQVQLGGKNMTLTNKKITDGTGNAVATQSIATPQQAYTRITDIQTSNNKLTKQQRGLVINVWAKSEPLQDGQITQAFAESYSGALPGLPIANLPAQQRNELLNQMKDTGVYTVNYKASKQEEVNGRQVRTYTVTVNLEPYVAMLKKLGSINGVNDYADATPANYKNKKIEGIKISIDVRARHVVSIYDPSNNFIETYSSYGVAITQTPPKDGTVSEAVLQARFTQLGNQ